VERTVERQVAVHATVVILDGRMRHHDVGESVGSVQIGDVFLILLQQPFRIEPITTPQQAGRLQVHPFAQRRRIKVMIA
jgi:hypothetical protein